MVSESDKKKDMACFNIVLYAILKNQKKKDHKWIKLPSLQSQSLYSPSENNVTVYTEMTGFTAEASQGLVKTRTFEKVKKTSKEN